jgi:uncharacterized sporulation protein YeaH/YhbH (DUF444 family)
MANEKLHQSYRAFLLRQPCRCDPCISPVVIHHNTFGETEQHAKSVGGKRGKGQRASDLEGMPLCNKHHRELHELRGFFGDYNKADLREWQARQVRELQNQFAVQEPQPVAAEKPAARAAAVRGAGDAVTRAWLAGSSAERARIISWLEETAARTGLHSEAHAALMESAEVLRHAEPAARPR